MSKTVAEIKDANKRGALHFAAREAQTEVCNYLIEELKLDVDTKDEDGIYFFLSKLFLLMVLRILLPYCS